jgi:hypothetical protein
MSLVKKLLKELNTPVADTIEVDAEGHEIVPLWKSSLAGAIVDLINPVEEAKRPERSSTVKSFIRGRLSALRDEFSLPLGVYRQADGNLVAEEEGPGGLEALARRTGRVILHDLGGIGSDLWDDMGTPVTRSQKDIWREEERLAREEGRHEAKMAVRKEKGYNRVVGKRQVEEAKERGRTKARAEAAERGGYEKETRRAARRPIEERTVNLISTVLQMRAARKARRARQRREQKLKDSQKVLEGKFEDEE